MAIATVTGDPTIARMRAVYDRPRRPISGQAAKLIARPKEWGLAKYSPRWGWVTVSYFATFEEANRHRWMMERTTTHEGAISHREDGAPLRAYELYINRLRRRNSYDPRINTTFVEAMIWAARRGFAVSSELCSGLVALFLVEEAG
ncbi:MAG: hypothetical protein AAF609_05605 [Cyanobacteria bacterium P01_C01_bin.120]